MDSIKSPCRSYSPNSGRKYPPLITLLGTPSFSGHAIRRRNLLCDIMAFISIEVMFKIMPPPYMWSVTLWIDQWQLNYRKKTRFHRPYHCWSAVSLSAAPQHQTRPVHNVAMKAFFGKSTTQRPNNNWLDKRWTIHDPQSILCNSLQSDLLI